MNRLITIPIFLFLMSFPVWSQNQDVCRDDDGNSSVFIPIAKYMERGDAECLAAWFADNLQLDVMGTISNCSRNQARQIIRNFFTNYTPRCFEIVYRSGCYPVEYAVGNLDSGGNMFTVTILVKTNDSRNYIEQLKIEKQ
ncbi:MAG TPA: DUF4783 domain-containing protein [Candidatus Coprenecus stercoravium]|uniref:DUF4783 domain-containing protein n=1 Tax=Candidatus Coprenecus stercoravium TaxID=2840735 RepID=A0A9D2K940_9BACT|nr:DUF4783 domain-containing protein [Candidatus Coprenecus stercoravium]